MFFLKHPDHMTQLTLLSYALLLLRGFNESNFEKNGHKLEIGFIFSTKIIPKYVLYLVSEEVVLLNCLLP